MTKRVVVRQFVIRTPDEYRAAMPEILAFDRDGFYSVTPEDDAIVVRQHVTIPGRT